MTAIASVRVEDCVAEVDRFDNEGERYTLSFRQFYVVIETTEGDVWGHDRAFDNWIQATALASRVEDRIVGGRDLDWDHWGWLRPAYGTAAYLRDEAEIVERERWDDAHGF